MKDKFLKLIQRKSWLLLALFFISSCSNEDIVKHPVITNKYDPSKPQALTGFIPEKGGIGDKIIVQGNFGTDLSKMKVIFADTKEANIISSDGTSIYCTVPKQPGGNNSVKVVVGDKELTIDKTFAYTQVQKVSTVCGTYNKRGDTDGNIYDALFNNVFAVGIVAGDNIVAVESDKQRVRLISESENLVTTLISGFKAGKPAINKTRDKMYFIDVKSAKVYILRRENSWQPELLREGITELSANNGETWSCVIDDEEKYLYTRNHLGIFVRINLTEKDDSGQYKVEKLLEHRWDFEAWVYYIYVALIVNSYSIWPGKLYVFPITFRIGLIRPAVSGISFVRPCAVSVLFNPVYSMCPVFCKIEAIFYTAISQIATMVGRKICRKRLA